MPRWRTALALLLLALLLHLALLAGASRAGLAPEVPPTPAPMQVRTVPAPVDATPTPTPGVPSVVAESAGQDGSAAPLAAPPAPAAPAQRARTQPPLAASLAASAATLATAAQAASEAATAADAAFAAAPQPVAVAPDAAPVATAASATSAVSAVSAPAAAAAATANNSPGHDSSVYQTRFPPPLTLVYDLRRGMLSGTGTLYWRPAGARYEARLEGRVAGLNVLTQVSQGGFDAAGIAPERFTDQRVGSAVRAANFQRERGLITFSGPSDEFSLLVGSQDRLSWMVQLAAVVSAEPQRLAPGGKVAIYVVGARADASMWVFRSAGEETLDTPQGPVRAVRFSREARGPYDTQADAWLDPARHGLPVKARLGTGSGNDSEALELLLRELTPG